MRNRQSNKKETKNIIIALPTAMTILNLSLGFLSLQASIHGNFLWAGWLIVLAAVIDGLDGVVARLTQSNSLFGVELDSLADAISFATATSLLFALWSTEELGQAGVFLAFIFLTAGILRLARYNVIQAKQKNRSFYLGLTVPSASVFIVALIMALSRPPAHPVPKFFLFLVMPLISLLMVSRIHYPNFIQIIYRHRLNLSRLLFTIALLTSFYLNPPLTLLIVTSINVSSGPMREAWRLTQKFILARSKGNEFPWR
ncbi:MAG: CDP-diacylglycerol--serine O-phosphatidyltransferase [Candidatus Aminicenantes bacterium]|nr:CDP-diacylglycerol--serine O-phosphatidyltransferase [Candidatus Aminicenantes bacterium]